MLHVHHADHAETLVSGLARVLAEPTDDVFAIDQVAVHSRGLERWLAQRLAHRLGAAEGRDDGICTAIDFPFPGQLLGNVLAAATGLEPTTDPWRVDRLAWRLLGLLETDPGLAHGSPLATHLRRPDGGAADGRFGAVRSVADLFDRYAVHRPEMLRRWAEGSHATPVLATGRPLPPGSVWQAGLWRALRDQIGLPSPAERLGVAAERLARDPECCDLPSRVSLFGLTALPASYLAVLRALAVHRDVHLFLLHPSPRFWQRAEPVLARAAMTDLPRRDDDPVGDLASNPLVRAWGRDAREMQVVLHATGARTIGGDAGVAGGPPAGGSGSLPTEPLPSAAPSTTSPTTRSLLGRLQADIRGDVAPPGPPGPGQLDQRPVLGATDDSVQIHVCHGRTRQVEVLRDVLLHRFADDPTLEPRDVLVLCPDIEAFAPLVEAVFAPVDDPTVDPSVPDRRLRPSALRVRVADRSLKRSNPLLRVVADVLALADGRVSATQVRDLAGRAPVRARFAFDEDDLVRLGTWIRQLDVRWGLDGDHRAVHGVPTDANTWASGIRRLLVGVAVADEDQRTVGDVVPFDDVAGSDLDLAGRVADLIVGLTEVTTSLADPRSMAAWRTTVNTLVDALTLTSDDPWQRVQLAGILDELVGNADAEAHRLALSLPEFRELLAGRLDAAAGRASHRTGDLTVCSLVPMRSVPHRVVCLLGMDDDAFPRRTSPNGDDLLEQDPRVGDRDARTEDRQLLLDAVLAAQDQVIVTYSGRDERTNDPRPPAVPIGELLDTIDRTVRAGTGPDPDPVGAAGSAGSAVPAARERITVAHPLHPFDPRNFIPGALGLPGRALGSDPGDLAGARALVEPDRGGPPTLLPDPLVAPDRPLLPPLDEQVIELDELVRAVIEPLPTFLVERLGLRSSREGPLLDDELSVELDGLTGWAVGARCLQDRLDGLEPDRTALLERLRGTLPPGALALPVIEDINGTIDVLLALADEHGANGPLGPPVEIDVTLPDGRRLIGAVDGAVGGIDGAVGGIDGAVGGNDAVVRALAYSRLKERHRLAAWVRLLALTAAHPEVSWRAVTIGRTRSGATKPRGAPAPQASASTLGPLGADPVERRELAGRELVRLVELRDLALTRPIPVVPATSGAWADAELQRRGGRRWAAINQAKGPWGGGGPVPGENALAANVHVFGPERPLEDLFSVPAGPGESGEGWDTQEASRFGRWALWLWEPLLAQEQVVDR